MAAAHLLAAGAAVGAALLILTLVRLEVGRLLHLRLDAFATRVVPMRTNGNLLQRAAFSDPRVLPVYGSSELDQPADNRPDFFFRGRPTGFSVFPEGHAGTTCLMILQKIAAAGNAVRGKKTAVFLSPSWFAKPDAERHATPASLPSAQLNAWVFDSPLRRALKKKLAQRLLNYLDASQDQPLTATAIRALAGQTWKDRCVFAGLWLLGECQHQMSLDLEAATVLWDVCRHAGKFRRVARPNAAANDTGPSRREVNWPHLVARAEARDRARDDGTIYSARSTAVVARQREVPTHPQPPGRRDAEFKTKMRSAEEWHDLKLMTRSVRGPRGARDVHQPADQREVLRSGRNLLRRPASLLFKADPDRPSDRLSAA